MTAVYVSGIPVSFKGSYDKFRLAGDISKPPFEEVYNAVKKYGEDILPPSP